MTRKELKRAQREAQKTVNVIKIGMEPTVMSEDTIRSLREALEQVNPTPIDYIPDAVDHPAHYNQGGIECFDAIVSAYGIKAAQSFCMINAFKYLWRAEHKNQVEDINKAIWYLEKYKQLEE